MNIFILNTGRCGSLTFSKACDHITNYTSAHESRSHKLLGDRFLYPNNHIEIDNRLSWLLGRLDNWFGDEAAYIHLYRNIEDTSLSFAKNYDGGIISAYRGKGIIMGSYVNDPISVCRDYWNTVNKNIELFLKDKTKQMEFNIDNAKHDFPLFWEFIRAKGNITKAIIEFDTRYNKSTLN